MSIDADRAARVSKITYVTLALVILFVLVELIVLQGRAPAPEFTLAANNQNTVARVMRGSGAEAAGLEVGDIIRQIGSTPFDQSSLASFSQRYKAGETVSLSVLRNGKTLVIDVLLVPASQVNPDRLILISLFILIGGTISIGLLWRFIRKPEMQLLYLLSQAAGVSFLMPLIQFSPWDALLPWQKAVGCLGTTLAFLLVFQFVLTFPVKVGEPALRRKAMAGLHLLGLAITVELILVAFGLGSILVGMIAAGLLFLFYIFTGITCSYAYFRLAKPPQRRQLRLIFTAFLVSVGPSTFLYSLPKIFFDQPVVPEWLAGIFLIASLIVYAYAILRQNLTQADLLLNRTVVYFVLFAVVFIILDFQILILDRILPNDLIAHSAFLAGVTLVVAYLFTQFRQWVQERVDNIFYGGWYDYATVVETTSTALAHSLTWDQLNDILTRQVPDLMNLTGAWLARGDAIRTTPMVDSQSNIRIPIMFENAVYALWAIGSRVDGDYFKKSDRDILDTLAPQIEVALSNILHVDQLREQLEEIRASQITMTQMGHQLIRSRDQEQERLSRELHDGPLQELVGMNLQVGLLLSRNGPELASSPLGVTLSELQKDVRGLMSELRQVCSGLRPPMLDALGLSSALRVLIDEWSADEAIPVHQELTSDTRLAYVNNEVGLNLYRVVQQALSNVARHAEASQVTISLAAEPSQERITLTIRDNGKGFDPEAIYSQEGAKHFGLASMRERVRLIAGHWSLISSPGEGTTIEITWQRQDWVAASEVDASALAIEPV